MRHGSLAVGKSGEREVGQWSWFSMKREKRNSHIEE